MDPRSEIEVRERLTRLDAHGAQISGQQSTNTSWISRLSMRTQHLEAQIGQVHQIAGRVRSLEEHSQITRRERERRIWMRAMAQYIVSAAGGLLVLLGALGKDQYQYALVLFGFN